MLSQGPHGDRGEDGPVGPTGFQGDEVRMDFRVNEGSKKMSSTHFPFPPCNSVS